MFESFNISKISIENPVVLALYGIGRTDGLVCSSGESSTYTVASFGGYLLESAAKKTKFAGSAVTEHLTGLL
jgi:actin-related protein